MKIGRCLSDVDLTCQAYPPPRPTVDTGSESGNTSEGVASLAGCFHNNPPCRLWPAPQGMKMGPGNWELSTSTVPALTPWVPGFPGTTSRGVASRAGYFRTNSPCRLPPAPQGMKMGCAGWRLLRAVRAEALSVVGGLPSQIPRLRSERHFGGSGRCWEEVDGSYFLRNNEVWDGDEDPGFSCPKRRPVRRGSGWPVGGLSRTPTQGPPRRLRPS